jgi:surfeit locus 1 family protein
MKPSFYIFMGVCVCIFLALGAWQVKRLAWKENLLAQINKELSVDAIQKELKPTDFKLQESYMVRRGYLKGTLDLSQSILWRGQIFNGAPAYYVVAPFQSPHDKFIVPVVVGMCYVDCDEVKPNEYKNIKIIGILKRHKDNIFRAKNNIPQGEWYRMDHNDLSSQWGNDTVNALFYAENSDIDPYLSPVESVVNIPNNHKQYAVFWFTMAALILSLTIYQFITSRRK